MKKSLITLLAVALIGSALAGPALAGKKKGKKAKPTPVTFYMHGNHPVDDAHWIDDTANSVGWLKMDTTKPTDPAPKSRIVTNYVGGPNSTCSGNNLFPTWSGSLTGTVVGDVKMYVNAVTHPANKFRIDLFPDGTGGCDSSLGSTGYTEPVATAEVELAPGGETEIVFEKLKFEATSHLIVMITPVSNGTQGFYPYQARILYDSPNFATRVEFDCVPAKGAKSCA